jgi:hypothetical protein
MGKKTYAQFEECCQNYPNNPLSLIGKRMEYPCSNNNVGIKIMR